MPSTARQWSSLLCVLMSPLGCSGVAPIPDTPNLEDVQDRYDHPTAALDAATVQDTIRQVPQFSDLALGFRATEYAIEGVDQAEESPGNRFGPGIRIQGALGVTLACPGAQASQGDGANGNLSMTIAVADSLVRRGIHGVASHCMLRGDRAGVPALVEVDGPVDFDLGRDLPLGRRWTGRLLVVAQTISIQGVAFRNVSARFTDALLEHVYEQPDGTTVVFQLTDAGLTIRDREGTWGCSSGSTCTFD
jgi:hypothetical protein